MRLTRTVLPALLVAVLLSGCGGTTPTGPTGSKGTGTPSKATTPAADPKAADAAKKFATDFLVAVRDKKATPAQLTPEFTKVFSDSPAADLTFLATEVAADEVSVTTADGAVFAVGKSKTGGGRTLLRLVKSGSDYKVDWISVGVKGVTDATLSGDDAPAQFAVQALLDAAFRKKYTLAGSLMTEAARNKLGESVFGGKFDPGALKNKLDEFFSGVDKYTVTGTSKGTVTVELPVTGGKKTATLKAVKGSRPGEWLVDAVEVK